MLKIKLVRMGKNKSPFYRIAVLESRTKITSNPVEYLGHYNPIQKVLVVDKEKLAAWTKKGAILTPSVKKLCQTS